jgi:hypothetical protein
MCRKPLIDPVQSHAALMEAMSRGGAGLQEFFNNELRGEFGQM